MSIDSKTNALKNYVEVANYYKQEIKNAILKTRELEEVPLFTHRTVANYRGTER